MGNASGTTGNILRTLLTAAVNIGEVFSLLTSAKEQSKELAAIIKHVKNLIDTQAETGVEIPDKALKEILKSLKALKDAPEEVGKAVKSLEDLFKSKEKQTDATPDKPNLKKLLDSISEPPLGNIPIFSQGKLQASVKPGVYKARLIKAGKALDGKVWTEVALKGAVESGKFENKPVRVMVFKGKYGDIENHINDEVPTGAIFGNDVGFVKGATWSPSDKSVYASVWITDTNRRALIDAMLEQDVELPGMSIYATGSLDPNTNRVTVIQDVDSMDLVTFPAADGRILARALTASISTKMGARVMAADVNPAGMDQPAPPEAPKPQAPPKPEGDETGEKFGAEWLKGVAARFAQDMLAGTEMSGDVSSGIDVAVTEISGAEYDKNTYPLEQVVNLLNKVHALVFNKEEEKQEEMKPADENKDEVSSGFPPPPPQRTPGMMAREKVGGALMNVKDRILASNQDQLDRRLSAIEERVNSVDTESMVAKKLIGSNLPDPMVIEMARELKGKPVTPQQVDEFIGMQRRVVAGIGGNLARNAAVNIEGNALNASAAPADLKAAVEKLFKTKTFKRD